ncbi:Sec23/Sec24 trunk domain-containing protein [Gongronella butleri]|nr:Sec23/Sec24 trunk domain-containing protein [Gongronella butleri]
MRAPQQPRPRIDPDQMPAPVQVREQDQLAFENQFFGTMERDRVPLATTDYIGLDQGNANPRFMRATTDKIPMTKDLADTSKLPLALVVHPLAKRRSDEVAIQVVDHGEEGPVRCSRCRAYISPWCVFIQGGARFVCSICSHANDVPSWYFSNTDMSGRRVDIEQRPELRYGSVEFEVPKDYHSTRAPAPLSYVFAIDVSAQALQTGMVNAACEAIKFALYASSLDQFKLAPENKIGILTFDKSVHFYNLHASLPQAQMLVVPDIEDMFVPFQDGFLVDSHASRDIILELLDALPTMFQENARRESVFTAAIQGGRQALASTGGFMHVFQSCLPNHGPHALKSRDDKNLYNTEKEKGLMVPQSDAYKELAKECVKDGVCVNAWLFPTQYTDVATLAVIPETTGGDVRYFAGFNYATDASTIHSQLDRDIHRELGYDGILRIRCCDGLQVIDHYGNCNMSTYTDMELAGIDEDKAMAAVLKHDSKLDASRGVSFQCALLYTTKNGLRRVRVHNINLTATSEIAEVFRHGDVDTTISVMLRKAIFDLQHKDRKAVHQALTDQCVNILTAYRVNCASSTSPGQLILPEAFKLLPVYVHGAIRSKTLRGVGSDMNADARAAGMRLFNGLGVKELAWTLYPRLFPIHSMEKDCGDVGVNGYMKLPAMLRSSYERLDTNGIYLLDTGSQLFVWLGNKVDSTLLQDMFGVKTLDEVDPKMTTLPALNTDLSHRVHAIIDKLQAQRSRHLQLHVIRMEKDPLEFVYSTWMTEDRNAEVQTYVDYMCVLHRKIQEEMKKLQH